MEKKEFHVVIGYPRDDGVPGYQLKCPHCGKTHRHGVGEGHRASHCKEPNEGYIIKNPL